MPKLVEGQVVEIEIRSPSRRDKSAVARYVGPAEGEPRVLAHAPTIDELLRLWVKSGSPTKAWPPWRPSRPPRPKPWPRSSPCRAAATSASKRPAPWWPSTSISGGRDGDSKKAARAANMAAFTTAARILRLKGWRDWWSSIWSAAATTARP
jgi:hypothetical protein